MEEAYIGCSFLTDPRTLDIMRPARVVSSVGERFPDAEEAAGSIPAPPTTDIEKGAPFVRGVPSLFFPF
ncbi:MAG: hypothetical protein PWQ16_127 [bacterium]|nr:hypothetical protein [bacterium]